MSSRKLPKIRIPAIAWIILGLVVCVGIAWATESYWRPLGVRVGILADESPAAAEHPPHEPHAATDAIVLSEQARKNIGLEVGQVALGTYEQTVSIPAIVTEQPGRTHRIVAAPLTGFVVDVFAVPGEAVSAGDPLFVLQLTNEDLVDAQTEFLNTRLALDVEKRELNRLESITEGAIAQKLVIEQNYKVDKLEGQLLAQRQRLVLHGLSEQQIDSIAQEHRLLREFLISAPTPHPTTEPGHLSEEHPRLVAQSNGQPETGSSGVSEAGHSYIVDELSVEKGQLIKEGETLTILSDLSHIYIGGAAFERDAPDLRQAAEENWKVSAVLRQEGARVIPDLDIVFVANDIDPQARTLPFYVELPNEIVHTARREHGLFPTWKYKPGQRMEVLVPVERWENQIVLPTSAVASDGAERYVFIQSGKTFRRVPVHVLHRDPDSVVIANDGSVYPGTSIAMNGAHQLLMALKNQAGGGVDPHAGHSH